jgi:hypothetical protein
MISLAFLSRLIRILGSTFSIADAQQTMASATGCCAAGNRAISVALSIFNSMNSLCGYIEGGKKCTV